MDGKQKRNENFSKEEVMVLVSEVASRKGIIIIGPLSSTLTNQIKNVKLSAG